jgi:hypothetical protein
MVLWFHVMPCVHNEGQDTSCTGFTYSSSYNFMPNLATFRCICCLTHRWSFLSQTACATTEICASVIKFPLSWHYNLWDLAYSTILFHVSLSIAILLQFWTYNFPRSDLTSSSHLNLGVPTLLTVTGLYYVILLTSLSLSILTICPIHHILCAVIYLTISARVISKSILSLSSYSPPSILHFLLGHMFSLLLSFQTLLIVLRLSS